LGSTAEALARCLDGKAFGPIWLQEKGQHGEQLITMSRTMFAIDA
jgi:hypothetical protein